MTHKFLKHASRRSSKIRQTGMETAEWNLVAHTWMSAVWWLAAECVKPLSLPVGSSLLRASCSTHQ